MSDNHLGFQKQEALQRIEQEVFERALDECISRKVDFVIIAGDLFHVNIPDMRVQKYAFAKFRQVHEAGIPVYVVYGSHDSSPVSDSVIDLLVETGYMIKVTKVQDNDGIIKLGFTVDEKTGAKLVGLSGLKVGNDKQWYEQLDLQSLQDEPGIKIFVFHGAITEMKKDTIPDGDSMPISLLPRGFAYYAGGHKHNCNIQKFPNHPVMVYPGTPFAGHHLDLEESAKRQRRGKPGRGMVIVECDDTARPKFVSLDDTKYEIIQIDADKKTTDAVNADLLGLVRGTSPAGKIIMIKISGELVSGKTADVDIIHAREYLMEEGALAVNINNGRLTSKEYSITEPVNADRDDIAHDMFAENIGQMRLDFEELLDERGIQMAQGLLGKLTLGALDNEKKGDYTARINSEARAFLGLDDDS